LHEFLRFLVTVVPRNDSIGSLRPMIFMLIKFKEF